MFVEVKLSEQKFCRAEVLQSKTVSQHEHSAMCNYLPGILAPPPTSKSLVKGECNNGVPSSTVAGVFTPPVPLSEYILRGVVGGVS